MAGLSGNRRILVVDDEPAIADTLALIFRSNGYEARTAYSAEQALELLEAWQPDLSIIDVVLPGMNGIEFAIFLQASYPEIHFLLFSGQPGTERPAGGRQEERSPVRDPGQAVAPHVHAGDGGGYAVEPAGGGGAAAELIVVSGQWTVVSCATRCYARSHAS